MENESYATENEGIKEVVENPPRESFGGEVHCYIHDLLIHSLPIVHPFDRLKLKTRKILQNCPILLRGG